MTEIPEDVMRAAREAIGDARGGAVMVIARAILAERERCANVALEAAREFHKDAGNWTEDGMFNAARHAQYQVRAATIIAERINNA